MLYRTSVPRPPLAGLVDHLWSFEGASSQRKERILPSGTIELVVNLRENEVRVEDPGRPGGSRRFSGTVVSGTYSRPFVIDARQHESMLGVHFRPGGAFPFLGVPASELFDSHVDLTCLWGDSALALRERLGSVQTVLERFRIVEGVLASRLRTGPERHRAVPAALHLFARGGKGLRSRDVAREVGLCQRRFIQVFRSEVGLPPKLFSRLQRFQRARALARRAPRPDWAELALSCGYFDQAHLIHEFREFAGVTPSDSLRLDPEDARLKAGHILLDG